MSVQLLPVVGDPRRHAAENGRCQVVQAARERLEGDPLMTGTENHVFNHPNNKDLSANDQPFLLVIAGTIQRPSSVVLTRLTTLPSYCGTIGNWRPTPLNGCLGIIASN